jgi:hypothetical protein
MQNLSYSTWFIIVTSGLELIYLQSRNCSSIVLLTDVNQIYLQRATSGLGNFSFKYHILRLIYYIIQRIDTPVINWFISALQLQL